MPLLAYPIQSINIGGRVFGAEYRFPLHVQTWHQFYAVLEGKVRVKIEGREILLRAGEALWMAPALRREPRAASAHGRYLNVTFASPWPGLGAAGEKVTLGRNGLAEAKQCADLREAGAHEQAAAFHALCFHLLGSEAFADAGAAKVPEPADNEGLWMVSQLEEFMEANMEHALGIADMASLVHASRATLGRLFRKHRGTSPAARFRRMRLERGHHLLRTSPLSITEIALETGFSSSQHFATAFRKCFGRVPSDLR